MHLSELGEIVAEEWQRTSEVRSYVRLDAWVVMPNHLHGILVLTGSGAVTTPSPHGATLVPRSLGAIVGQFKTACTRRIWAMGRRDFNWQTRFFDQIIRDEKVLDRYRFYILKNPALWEKDRHHPRSLAL